MFPKHVVRMQLILNCLHGFDGGFWCPAVEYDVPE
jgi:hypothetical protein